MLNFFGVTTNKMISYDVPWFMYAAIVAALLLYALIEAWQGRSDHVLSFKQSVKWSVFYISLAILFTIPVYIFIGEKAAAEYIAAWAVEKALSLDNLFVFGLIFTAFNVERKYRRRILNYGIVGAILFRLIFILAGFELLQRFSWISIVFGLILIRAAWHALQHARHGRQENKDITKSWSWRAINKILPIHPAFVGNKLTTKVQGKRVLTLMAGVIILIELTDIVFAVDSVPAVLAVSPDRYIAYASNVFAILGLRSLFFVYDSVATKLWALNWSLAVILFWIGGKLILAPFGYHIATYVNLIVIFIVLGGGGLISVALKQPHVRNQ